MDENLVSFQPGLAHLDYHRRVADMGVYIQYDTFGAEWYYDQNREPMDAERSSAGLGYDYLFTGVKALLTQAGVTDTQFQQILVHNPRGALALTTS
jgi:predicted metal-dependent phosphotriesterase family hydrolase